MDYLGKAISRCKTIENSDFRIEIEGIRRQRKAGFTLVETMVAISIAGILLSLLLLGIQQALEASRLTKCANHLRQIATAVGSFEATHQHLPSGGWSKNWAGVPSLGVGPAQPGGWIYQLLPYLDQTELFSIGANPGTGMHDPKLLESPIPTLFCPSQRKGRAYHNSRDWQPHLYSKPNVVARNDYAMNGGDTLVTYGEGPDSIAQAKSFAWPSMKEATGIVFQRSWLRGSEITDGRSNVYLAGEKYLFTEHYRDGGDWGDNECAYSGDDRDLVRFTGITRYAPLLPLPDTLFDGRSLSDSGVRFGGPHHGFVQMAYADSSVRTISFDVDLDVHQQLGNRKDGLPTASQSNQ